MKFHSIFLFSRILGNRPNTYCLTKAVAEEAVRIHGEGLPICIVRPSIGEYLEHKILNIFNCPIRKMQMAREVVQWGVFFFYN